MLCSGHVHSTGDRVGGLIGHFNPNEDEYAVRNCFAWGDVEGVYDVGGLVGNLDRGSITNSYAVGKPSGVDFYGGLLGWLASGTVTGSYWDIQRSETTVSAGGTGKTTLEMKTRVTFVDWNFDTIWEIKPGRYPHLIGLPYPRLKVIIAPIYQLLLSE